MPTKFIILGKIAPGCSEIAMEKRGSDRSYAPKTLSFGEKISKIGPADTEIICF